MTKCEECGTEISTTAVACPKCGAKQERILTVRTVSLVVAFVIVAAYLTLRDNTNGAAQAQREAKASSDAATALLDQELASLQSLNAERERKLHLRPSEQQERKLGLGPGLAANEAEKAATIDARKGALEARAQWSYLQKEDPMGKGNTRLAIVNSSNTVTFNSPYDGAQQATLRLRTHPRYGKDVILSIERGQFLCRSYEDCTVLVRFDDQKASSYSGAGASDNSTETIFIKNYPRFVASMLKAKRVRISAEIYQEGAPVFEFDVAGFDEAKYNPKQ